VGNVAQSDADRRIPPILSFRITARDDVLSSAKSEIIFAVGPQEAEVFRTLPSLSSLGNALCLEH
jgi:hypothetical protein